MNIRESMHTVRKRVHTVRENCSTVRKRSPNVRKYFGTASGASTSLLEIFSPASGRTPHEFLLTFWKLPEVILTSLHKHSTADDNIYHPSGALTNRQQRASSSRPEHSTVASRGHSAAVLSIPQQSRKGEIQIAKLGDKHSDIIIININK